MMERKVIRTLFCLCFLVVALAGCSGSEDPSSSQTTTITGTVIAPAGDADQFIAARTDGILSRFASFVLGSVYADITGLTPVAGATVELVRLSNGSVEATATTDENGVYTFTGVPAIGPGSTFVVRVTGESDVMRAIVTGEVVDISPASEVVVDTVLGSLGGGTVLGNFMVQEVAALNGLLVSMDIDVTGMSFGDAVQAISDAAGTIFLDLVAAFSAPGVETVLRSSNYSVVDYSASLKDPLIVPEDGAKGGVEIDSGQGTMIFAGTRDRPTPGLVAIGKFLHDFTSVEDPSGAASSAFPYLRVLDPLLHVTNAGRQVIVADSSAPSVSVAGVGATTASGSLMVYPLDSSVRVDDAPSVSGMGIRFATRWPQPGPAQPTLHDLTLLDTLGGGGTVYNQVQLQQRLAGQESGANTVTMTTSVGTVTFDSTPQFNDFDEPKAFGSFVSNSVTDSLQLDLADYAVAAGSGSDVLSGLYYVQPNGGLVQFRDEVGTLLGWGTTPQDGERDGEVVGINMFSGGFDEPVTDVERSFSVAIRSASGMTASSVSGTYNVVEYAGYLSNDLAANPPAAFVQTGIRYGTVSLNGLGGVNAGTLFHRRATIDVAAARGETGAEPNVSGASGAFTTANAGDAGETFALIVGGVTVFTFTSTAGGDTVTEGDIQAGLETVLFDLLSAGITVSGTVAGGDLAFTKSDGSAFDIEVINEFTGTASAAGGFTGADFATGTRTIDNASPAVPNASGSSGEFTTATAGAAGETFTLSVDDITVFTFTSAAAGDTVTAADIQGGLAAATAALEGAGFTIGGSVTVGNLVFTRADGAPFTIEVVNGFTGLDGAVGGFAGADFATGTNTIEGNEAVPAEPNASGASGAFTTATAGAAGETFTLSVDDITVFTFTSENSGDTVTAADIQGGLAAATAALEGAGFTIGGSVTGGNLVFTRADGAPFTILVTNTFTGIGGAVGGFAGADFATGTNTIQGTEAVPAEPNASGASGAFTTATAGAAGETFTLSVDDITVFTFTSAAAGDTVTAADIQGGLAAATGALEGAGFTIGGSVTGGNLVFTRADGAPFTILVTNTFTGIAGTVGGFAGADFATGTNTIQGTEAAPAVPNASGISGAFTTATAGAASQNFALTVAGVEVFSFTSSAPGDTVTAANVQDGVNGAVGALGAVGIEVDGTVAGGDLVFTRTNGTPFTILVTNTFTGIAGAVGGFAGADFATGTNTIQGTEAVPAEPNASGASGAFTPAVAGGAGEIFALNVDDITVFTRTSLDAGDTVEAADVQDGVNGALGALSAAGFTVQGTVADEDLVFIRADGAPFTILVTNTFSGTPGGFAGADFAANTPHEIDEGAEAVAAVPATSGPSGAFATATSVEAGQTYSLTVGGVPVFSFTSSAAGQTVTAADVQGGVNGAVGALSGVGIEVEGTVGDGTLAFTRASGVDFAIVVVNTFTSDSLSAGGFAGANFAANTPHEIDEGAEAVAAVPAASGPSGAFATATSVEAGQTYSLTVGGVPVFSFTSSAAGQTVTAADVQGGVSGAVGALSGVGIEVEGTVGDGTLAFTRASGADFAIVVVNTFTSDGLSAGGFGGADFAANTPHEIDNGAEAVEAEPAESGPSGPFTTATSVESGQTYSLTVGGVPVFSFTSSAAGQTVTAADVQGGVNGAVGALSGVGIEVEGTVGDGTLAFTRASGVDFAIVVVNTFTSDGLSAGGFGGADFAANTPHEIDNGAEAVEAEPAESGPSGPFTTATSVEAGQTYSLTVGGVPVFSFTSSAAGQTVTAADVQGGVNGAVGALSGVGIEVEGTVGDGTLAFTRASGADFAIVVVNTFTSDGLSAGGFGGADFAANAPHEIDNGAVVGTNASGVSGEFELATAGDADETYSLTVGGVEVFTFTSADAGDTVTAADVQAGLVGASAALEDAGITFTGTATGGNLVFTREDGAPFDIVVVNEFTGTTSTAGGFAGADFALGVRTVDNGQLAGPAPSLSSASGQQSVLSGSYNVIADGEMNLILTVGDETITGSGAVSQGGDFIALATSSNSDDDTRKGRGILFLIRRP